MPMVDAAGVFGCFNHRPCAFPPAPAGTQAHTLPPLAGARCRAPSAAASQPTCRVARLPPPPPPPPFRPLRGHLSPPCCTTTTPPRQARRGAARSSSFSPIASWRRVDTGGVAPGPRHGHPQTPSSPITSSSPPRHSRRRHHHYRGRGLIDAGRCWRDQEGRRRGEAGGGGGRRGGGVGRHSGAARTLWRRGAPRGSAQSARGRDHTLPRAGHREPPAHPHARTPYGRPQRRRRSSLCAACAHWVRMGSPDVFARSGTSFWASRVAFLRRPACRHAGSEYPRVRAFSSRV